MVEELSQNLLLEIVMYALSKLGEGYLTIGSFDCCFQYPLYTVSLCLVSEAHKFKKSRSKCDSPVPPPVNLYSTVGELNYFQIYCLDASCETFRFPYLLCLNSPLFRKTRRNQELSKNSLFLYMKIFNNYLQVKIYTYLYT